MQYARIYIYIYLYTCTHLLNLQFHHACSFVMETLGFGTLCLLRFLLIDVPFSFEVVNVSCVGQQSIRLETADGKQSLYTVVTTDWLIATFHASLRAMKVNIIIYVFHTLYLMYVHLFLHVRRTGVIQNPCQEAEPLIELFGDYLTRCVFSKAGGSGEWSGWAASEGAVCSHK